ncbi:MAG: hydrogenase expression/formation protein HypE, partial [uncultured bacterium]
MENKYIKLSHGSGKGQDELLREIIIPILLNNTNSLMEDSAILKNKNKKLAFTTDSFVVTPLEFPGADIGKLAACGTINDLSMMGAIPEYISVALILEEGLEVELLKRVLKSLKKITDECSVQIVCGDTKVVSKGSADGIFITTAGIGYIPDKYSVSIKKIRKNDAIIVSGTIGLHGVTVLSKRKNLDFVTDIESDCAPLDDISQRLLTAVPETHALRDATRGGVSAVLNEIASSIDLTFEIDE